MSEQQAEKLLAVLVLARSSSYLMSKFVLGELDTFNLLALRFLIAFAVLLVVLHKHCRQVKGKVLFHGAVIGTTFFLTLAAERIAAVRGLGEALRRLSREVEHDADNVEALLTAFREDGAFDVGCFLWELRNS